MKTCSKNCAPCNGVSAPVRSSRRNFTRPASPSLNWTKRQQSGSGFTSTTSQYTEQYLAHVSGSIFAGVCSRGSSTRLPATHVSSPIRGPGLKPDREGSDVESWPRTHDLVGQLV